MDMMTKQQTNTPHVLPKRLSPELAEVLHMLKSLETQTPTTSPQRVAN
jgi:hypothetical protein